MRVGVIGAGYVGAVTAAHLAESGHDVTCVDIDENKVAQWNEGNPPIYEPGLDELVGQGMSKNHLRFTTSSQAAISGAEVVFIAVGTPQGEDNSADLSYVLKAANDIGTHATGRLVAVDKSTVPIGTSLWVEREIGRVSKFDIPVVSNPEFLREGSALQDVSKPEQIVIGTNSDYAANVMQRLYAQDVRRNPDVLDIMDPASAETVKYGINAFLAVKISYANELAQLCKKTGANYDVVRMAIGRDSRIGDKFLYTGPGWGGSCFPKDTRAVVKMAEDVGVDLSVVKAAIDANERQKRVVPRKVEEFFAGRVDGRRIALWGLAFKDRTDDVRESPALAIVDALSEKGAYITAYDPEANGTFARQRPDVPRLSYAKDEYSALEGAELLVVATNWREFFGANFDVVVEKVDAIVDGRDMWDPADMQARGFYYDSMGRGTVDGRQAA